MRLAQKVFLYFICYKIPKVTKFEIKYARGAINVVKEITFDFTFASFSNTAIEIIHEITSVISAINVILLITAAHPMKI